MDCRGGPPDSRTLGVVVGQGDIVWADLGEPTGSGPGYVRPVVIVQGDAFNASRLATVVVVPLTSNLRWAEAPGNVVIPSKTSGLSKDSVANVSQIVAVDRSILVERIGRVSRTQLRLILEGIDVVLGRT
jgi:mRNA interferase MazF